MTRLLPLALLLLACESADAFAPQRTQRAFTPPTAYEQWYGDVARCADSDRPYEGIEWYRETEPWVELGTGAVSWAAYWSPRTIVLTERVEGDRGSVTHEMLHYAIEPVKGHPQPPFGVCAPLGVRIDNTEDVP